MESNFGENKIVSGFTFNSMLSYYIISSFLAGIDMSKSTSEEICNRVKLGTFSKYMIIQLMFKIILLLKILE